MDNYLSYTIAHLVLVGLIFLSNFFFCCVGFCFVRRKNDPERRGIHFYKAANVFFQLCCFFDVIYYAFRLVNYYSSSSDLAYTLLSEFGLVTDFFDLLTSAMLVAALTRIGTGILRASCASHELTNGTGNLLIRLTKPIGWGAYAFAGLIVVLAIPFLAVGATMFSRLTDALGLDNDLYNTILNQYLSTVKLQFAMVLLLFFASLFVLAFSITVLVLTLRRPIEGPVRRMSTPAIYLLVCSILFVMVRSYKLGEFNLFYDVTDFLNPTHYAPLYIMITSAIFHFITTYVIIILLTFLARVRDYNGGLWSLSNAQAQQWAPPVQQQQQPYPQQQYPQQGYIPPPQQGQVPVQQPYPQQGQVPVQQPYPQQGQQPYHQQQMAAPGHNISPAISAVTPPEQPRVAELSDPRPSQ